MKAIGQKGGNQREKWSRQVIFSIGLQVNVNDDGKCLVNEKMRYRRHRSISKSKVPNEWEGDEVQHTGGKIMLGQGEGHFIHLAGAKVENVEMGV